MPRSLTAVALLVLVSVSGATVAQPVGGSLLKQEHDGEPAVTLTGPEIASLGDPLFNLVLRRPDPPETLEGIENLLMPAQSGVTRQSFVVDERITDAAPQGTRRAVLVYRGTLDGQILARNVMLSVFFDPQRFPASPQIEALGWDNERGRYNYYKLDGSGTPDGRLAWKFRGSSVGADLRTPSDRRGSCMACHVNGAPVMKELLFPWNNWHSFKFLADYLSTAPAARRWQVASSSQLQTLAGAETLENDFILPAITHFNARRINEALARRDVDRNVSTDSEGLSKVVEGKRLLAPLFKTTEANLISSGETSGIHPFEPREVGTDGQQIRLPDSLFLNSKLIGGGEPGQLGITKARQFRDVAVLTKREYQQAVQSSETQLDGIRGDTHFAWFVPEPSHIDTDLVRQLVLRGILPVRVLAAALAVDLDTPVFSRERAQLLRFVPDTFRFKELPSGAIPAGEPLAAGPADDLVHLLTAALETSAPAGGSAAQLFLDRLKADDPVGLLAQDVNAYHQRIRLAFATPPGRLQETTRLQSAAVERRRQMLLHPILGTLDETQGALLPIKPPLVRPNRLTTEGHKKEQGEE